MTRRVTDTGVAEETPSRPGPAERAALGPWLRLILLAAAFAIPASVIAVLFVAAFRGLATLLWETVPSAVGLPAEAFVLGIPVAGGLVVGLILRFAPGHGGTSPAEEHGLGGSHPGTLRELPGTVAAALTTLATGPSLGPEAPLIGIMGTLGATTSKRLRLPDDVGRVLGVAGLSALLGGIFGNPLAAGLLILEVTPLVGRDLYRRIIPALVAATVGVYVFKALMGAPFTDFHFPAYPGFEPWHLAVAVAVGVGGAVIGLGYVWLSEVTGRLLRPLEPRVVTRAVLGGLAVGVIALVFGEITLFSGEHELQVVLDEGPSMAAIALVGIALAKIVAAVISIHTGFRGGRVFPVMFVGGTLGMALHVALPGIPAALSVATGMAGVGIATFRLPLFLTLLIIPFTSAEVAPLTLIAAITSWIIVEGRDQL